MGGDESYYNRGSTAPAKATSGTRERLEQRLKLTATSQYLVLCLVGLPGRGKSFISRKLHCHFTWVGADCQMFNVGKYRRDVHKKAIHHKRSNSEEYHNATEEIESSNVTGACDADFFSPANKMATLVREEAAKAAMKDMLDWFVKMGESSDKDHHVAIFDATNSTKKRRKWVLEQCATHSVRPGIIFVESICDDQELLDENFRYKISSSPDYIGVSEEEALNDLRSRVKNYENQYETIEDDSISYIKLYNLSSRVLANQIYGRMSKAVIPALMAWNVSIRPIWICRAAATIEMPCLKKKRNSAANLNLTGMSFRNALRDFIRKKGADYMMTRTAAAPSLNTGTSLTGLGTFDEDLKKDHIPFPCKVMCSTMPRSIETAYWDSLPYPIKTLSNLNPMYKGDFSGMEFEEIMKEDPEWYQQFKNDPFTKRFPGGECYRDLVNRLESCIIEMEQQVTPVLLVSHISIIQVLLSYFRNSPIEKCGSIDVPLHTVIELTPDRGGGWIESRHSLLDSDTSSDSNSDSESQRREMSHPVWSDKDDPRAS